MQLPPVLPQDRRHDRGQDGEPDAEQAEIYRAAPVTVRTEAPRRLGADEEAGEPDCHSEEDLESADEPDGSGAQAISTRRSAGDHEDEPEADEAQREADGGDFRVVLGRYPSLGAPCVR